nr:MBL fold metallo-hydrolase [Desulfobulbus rhabdoformis]
MSAETWKEWNSDYSCILVETGMQTVLIDTGLGAFHPFTGSVLENLKRIEIDPADIDIVLLTHAHPDHIGGTLDQEGESIFSNAKILMSQSEWEFWNSDPLVALKSAGKDEPHSAAVVWYAEQCLPKLQKQIQTVDGQMEIVPGIETLPAPGHTPGHQVIHIFSAEEALMVTGDVFLQPLHVEHPKWCPAVDINPDSAIKTRVRIAGQAAHSNTLVACFHFPFPGLGHIVGSKGKYQFKSLDMNTSK